MNGNSDYPLLALSDYSHIENHRHKPALRAFRSSIFSTCRIAVVREASQPTHTRPSRWNIGATALHANCGRSQMFSKADTH
jgi:hypothetical protein